MKLLINTIPDETVLDGAASVWYDVHVDAGRIRVFYRKKESKVDINSMLSGYGRTLLSICEYCDGGFILESQYKTKNRDVFVSFTPYNLLDVHVKDGCTIRDLMLFSASIWVTIKNPVGIEFDDEISSCEITNHVPILHLVT